MSVVKQAAKAYHVERLAFRVLKYTARARAQYFLRVFAPEITEEASRIVDEAVRSAEVELLGWTAEEVEKAQGQACLAFEFGGHDMQPRTDDRYLLHLAAWLESMEDEDSAAAPVEMAPIAKITRRAVLEHPRLAPRLEHLYARARERNATLPDSLEKFIEEAINGERGAAPTSAKRVKWQAALTHGLHKARADAWLKTTTRNDRDRVKEMAGDWIMDELPWWTHFQRPCWLIAMRLRYGLAVTPAIILNTSRRCLAKKQDGSFCLELLDDLGRHAQFCKVEGTAVHRHDTIRDGLVPGLKPHVSSVKLEQFIYELAQLNEDTGETKEARMDIVADMPQLRAMLDVRCYLSTLASGWRSARAHEVEAPEVRHPLQRATVYEHGAFRCRGQHVWLRRERI